MTRDRTILGVDVGAVSVALCELDGGGDVRHTAYAFHRGEIQQTLRGLLGELDLPQVGWVASTGSPAAWVGATRSIDVQLAHIAAATRLHEAVGAIVVLGGERFRLIHFDRRGRYRGSLNNSSCAAGTGSFLDQISQSLGLPDGAALAAHAARAGDVAPAIASRCAVFAKTDLIHAQQQGYSREAICNGLCDGLAGIVADTVLSGDPLRAPVALSGGVALNEAVRSHLGRRLGCELLPPRMPHLHAAFGAAQILRNDLAAAAGPGQRSRPRRRSATRLVPSGAEGTPPRHAEEGASAPGRWRCPEDLLAPRPSAQVAFHEPLRKKADDYPSFDDHRHYDFVPRQQRESATVEVDAYVDGAEVEPGDTVLGIDIGSTSTKAVLLDERRRVLVGAYTRTAGRPLLAVQGLFEALSDWGRRRDALLPISAVGTTGAGRKLVGAVVGADLVVDEISAHARAASELCPEVDTIIEIGGQDSKFTTLRGGRVTSAAMNTVCAAGTGSFIEEQARQLDCPLSSYADAVAGVRAPLASDRCTVFMQRDLAHLLNGGCSVPELLTTVLHSVRENYLRKVAREASIGTRICFQGATAKNRALVAAFEQRLGKAIHVSKYCHLTGALGVALSLREQLPAATAFRGLGIASERIDVATERCELCSNRCAITSAWVKGQQVAYGFRCGRDLQTERYVSANRAGFDLLRARAAVRRELALPPLPPPAATPDRPQVTVGLPAALQLFEQLPFWREFFRHLGVLVITSEGLRSPVSRGKGLTRAELCAPMTAFHAHVAHLAERADYVFVPTMLEAPRSDRRVRRQYCYYSQFASSLALSLPDRTLADRCLRPLIAEGDRPLPAVAELYTALRPALGPSVTRARVATAYHRATRHQQQLARALRQRMSRELDGDVDLAVVLLGRPYSCLAPQMNKGIPDILAAQGVKAFFQDMLTYDEQDVAEVADLLRTVHWHYGAQMLAAACVVANTPGLYPVLVTSFKCAPDSCLLEQWQGIFERHDKPYLVLELDEHDSALGYETRIEAAVRAFRNHHAVTARPRTVAPAPAVMGAQGTASLAQKTVFLPNWDPLVCELLVANLNRAGFRAQLLTDDADTTQKSMRLNSGQCTPMTIIAQGFIDAVEQRGMDPAATALWVIRSELSCNLGMFPDTLAAMLASYGRGFERAQVYAGEITWTDFSARVAVDGYFAYLIAGYLRRMACHVRPYERVPGSTDHVVATGLGMLREAFLGRRSKLEVVVAICDKLEAIEVTSRTAQRRPQVAIFGDLYTRDNDRQNQDLVRFIERHGGEVVTTPYAEYMKLVAGSYFRKWLREGKVLDVVVTRSLLAAARVLERRFHEQFERILGKAPDEELGRPLGEVLEPFGVTERHSGESFDNLLKISAVLRQHPDVSLFVQASPAFCCPSLVTEAMAGRIEEVTGIPVVAVTYDGTAAPKNDVLVPYLVHARAVIGRGGRAAPHRASG